MKVGMLFSDYGSQYVGMAKELYDNSRVMQELFEEASNCLNINFVKLCFAASDAELARVENTYPALFLTSFSIAAYIQEQGIAPSAVAGFGLGEFSAIGAIGGLTLPDGLYLLSKYAQFCQEAAQSWAGFSSIGVSGIKRQELNQLLQVCNKQTDQEAVVSAYESPKEYLIVGPVQAIESVIKLAKQAGATIYKDRVERGLHNQHMLPIVEYLKKYLTKVDFKDLSVPLIACVDGLPVTKGDLVKKRVMKQLHEPILWQKVMNYFSDFDILIEVGPGSTLSRITKSYYPNKPQVTINKLSDIAVLQELVKASSGIL